MSEYQGRFGYRRDEKFRVHPYSSFLSLIVRFIVGIILIYSGGSKALGPTAEFAAAIAAYHIVPADWVSTIATFWPWLELLVGTYLFFGYFTQLASMAATGLFAVFLTVLLSAIARGIDPGSCGCFGMGISLGIHKMAALDATLFILSIISIIQSKSTQPLSLDDWIKR
jgi:uncharacterized membrane protein YphA (DoxX/SURF4 family)